MKIDPKFSAPWRKSLLYAVEAAHLLKTISEQKVILCLCPVTGVSRLRAAATGGSILDFTGVVGALGGSCLGIAAGPLGPLTPGHLHRNCLQSPQLSNHEAS